MKCFFEENPIIQEQICRLSCQVTASWLKIDLPWLKLIKLSFSSSVTANVSEFKQMSKPAIAVWLLCNYDPGFPFPFRAREERREDFRHWCTEFFLLNTHESPTNIAGDDVVCWLFRINLTVCRQWKGSSLIERNNNEDKQCFVIGVQLCEQSGEEYSFVED